MLPEVFLDSVIKSAWEQKRENLNNFLKSPLSAERQSCSGEEEEDLQSVVFEDKGKKMESKVKGKQVKRFTDYGYLTNQALAN